MMVGQVMEIRRNGAVLMVREGATDKVFVPGWMRQLSNSEGTWLSTLSGECIGLGDLVAYYVDTHDSKPGYTAVGKNVMVLKESQDVSEKSRRRRRRQSTERSAGARYEVGETTDDEKPRRRRNKKKGAAAADTTVTEDSETEEDVTDGELEWLEKDLLTIIDKEDPATKTLKLLKDVHSQLHVTRGAQRKVLKRSGVKTNFRGGYTPMRNCKDDFWRMKRMLANVDAGYNSDSDPDYKPGDDIEEVTRPGSASDTQGDTSFTGSTAASSVHNRSGRSRKSSMGSMSTNNNRNTVTKRKLPYWVIEVSKAEKYDPEMQKFVADDKYYKEENDPDFELPATDDEIETEEEDEENEDQLSLLTEEASKDLTDDIKEGKYKEKPGKVVSPVKVTLTPSKDGDKEPVEQILTLESDGDTGAESDGAKSVKQPQLWEQCLVMTEQPDEYDSDEDPEYVPPAVILDTDLEYDELIDGEDYEVSDNELEQLKEEATKDAANLTPKCYMPIWIPVESPAERIERAKEQFAAVAAPEVDTSGKDTDSNGKKDEPVNKAVTGLQVETGLTPCMRKLSVGSKPESGNEGSPKSKRERKKSKSKGGEEKSGDEGEKKKDGDKEAASPKTPTRTNANGESKSPKKKSPEKKSPKKASKEEIATEKKEEAS